jgi:hypothetical protein
LVQTALLNCCELETFSSTLYHAEDLPFAKKTFQMFYTNRKKTELDATVRAVLMAH